MGFFLFLLVARMVKLRRWHQRHKQRHSVPPWFHELLVKASRQLNLGRLPAIVFSREAVTPAVYGIVRPVLLLPERYWTDLTPEEAELVLLHELCHLKRGDLWVHGVTLLLQVVYWFNPFLIWAMRQLRHVREMCCDQTLAARLGDRTEVYRQTLLNTARQLLTERVEPGMGLLGVFEEPFWLVSRIRWLEKKSWQNRKTVAATATVLVLAIGTLVLPMAGRPSIWGEASNLPLPAGNRPMEDSGKGQQPQAPAGSGYYCRMITREFTYFLGFETESRFLSMEESWYTSNQATLAERNLTFILDREIGRFTIINPHRRSYVETALPVERTSVLSTEVRQFLEGRKTEGQLELLGKTKEILGRVCDGFRLITWDAYGNEQSNRRENMVWVSSNAPFDVELFNEAIVGVRRLISTNEEFLQQEMRERMKGLQLGIETETYRFPWKKRYVMRMVELAPKIPPAGIFSVPKGFTRHQTLEMEDLR
jgi:hypothetical protein